MKKIFSIIICLSALVFTFSSCKNVEDDVFEDSSAVRLEQTKISDARVLASSPNGWIMEYFTKGDSAGYLMLVNFDANGSVLVAGKNKWTDNKYLEDRSSWQMIGDNGPVLTFNSYNKVLHKFSTPEDIPGTKDDEQGLGLEGDYEFIVIDAPENAQTVMLKGKKRSTYIRLTKLPEDVLWEDYFKQVDAFNALLFTGSPNPFILKDGSDFYTMYDGSKRIFNVVIPNGDPIVDVNYCSFVLLADAIRLYKPYECMSGNKIQEFKITDDNSKLVSVDNPNIWIEGPNPLNVFNEQIIALRKYVLIDGDMDANTQAIYDRIKVACAAKKVPLKQIYFGYSARSKTPKLVIQVSSASASYLYKEELMEDKITFIYDKFDDDTPNSGIFYQNYDGVSDLIKALSTTYVVGPNKSGLNYQTLKLTGEGALWLGVKLTN